MSEYNASDPESNQTNTDELEARRRAEASEKRYRSLGSEAFEKAVEYFRNEIKEEKLRQDPAYIKQQGEKTASQSRRKFFKRGLGAVGAAVGFGVIGKIEYDAIKKETKASAVSVDNSGEENKKESEEEIRAKLEANERFFKETYGFVISDGAVAIDDNGIEQKLNQGGLDMHEKLLATETVRHELAKYPPKMINLSIELVQIRFVMDMVSKPFYVKPDPKNPNSYAPTNQMRYELAFAFRDKILDPNQAQGRIFLQYNSTNTKEIAKDLDSQLHKMLYELGNIKDTGKEGIAEDALPLELQKRADMNSSLMTRKNVSQSPIVDKAKQDLLKWSGGKINAQYWKDLSEGEVDENYWKKGQ